VGPGKFALKKMEGPQGNKCDSVTNSNKMTGQENLRKILIFALAASGLNSNVYIFSQTVMDNI